MHVSYRFAASALVGCVLSSGARPAAADPPRYTVTEIGTFGGPFSDAHGLNASGRVVGTAAVSDTASHAFLFDYNGAALTDLGTLGGANSSAYDINDAG